MTPEQRQSVATPRLGQVTADVSATEEARGWSWSGIAAVSSPYLLVFIVILGVAVRIRQYALNRSLWLDEAFFALNIVARGIERLLTSPLDFNQGGPPVFLLTEKLATLTFGNNEYALRALPLVAGIAGLLLFVKLAQQVLPPDGALVALALFAACGPLVYYSAEVKPYAADVAVTVGVSVAALSVLDGAITLRRGLIYGLLGLVVIPASYGGVFAAAGIGALLLVLLTLQREWARLRIAAVMVALWALGAAIFVVAYVSNFRSYTHYFQSSKVDLAPLPPRSAADLRWYGRRLADVGTDANLYHPLSNHLVIFSVVAIILAVVGGTALITKKPRQAAILVAPILVTVLASGAHRYPMLPRTILFFTPVVFVFVGAGLALLARRLPRILRILSLAFVTAVLVAHVGFAQGNNVVKGTRAFEIKEGLSYIATRWHKEDVLFVHYASQYAYGYYATCGCFHLPNGRDVSTLWPMRKQKIRDSSEQFPPAFQSVKSNVILGVPGKEAFPAEVRRLRTHNRVWVLVTLVPTAHERRVLERQFFARLNGRGKGTLELDKHGVRVYLYRFQSK